MSTIEDFENAPIGATATSPDGRKIYRRETKTLVGADWVRGEGEARLRADADGLASFGYILGPAPSPAPTTAREALDLVWELAHPVKEGQKVEPGTQCIAKVRDGEFTTYRATFPFNGDTRPGRAEARTLDPLPDPEPDWIDAPAILASHPVCADTEQIGIWIPSDEEGNWEWPVQQGEFMAHWSELEDVTPLYPKEEA